MIKETKIGDYVIVEQTTYYVYNNEEDRKNDHYSMSTSDKRVIKDIEETLKSNLKSKCLKIQK